MTDYIKTFARQSETFSSGTGALFLSYRLLIHLLLFSILQLSSGEHEHLRDLSQIRFLVLDEADRMTQDHCFPQLLTILNIIHEANPRDEDNDYESESDESDDGDEDRMLGLPGLRAEAKVTMLSDNLLEQIEAQRNNTMPITQEAPKDESDDDESLPKVHRQTFIYSATLTLPFTSLNEKRKIRTKHGLVGGIAEILEKTQAMGQTKVVNLSSSSQESSASQSAGGIRLPPGLVLEQIKCTKLHKDSHLYAYLMTTSQGASGPCLVFCNSIGAVRRVGKTLECLRFSVRILHAQMQQVRQK
jgi:ATP-dependent RNA helicase DDX24/MAK5